MKNYFREMLKRKTRTDLINERVKDLLDDLFISDYTDIEIVFIINSMKEQSEEKLVEKLEKNKIFFSEKISQTELAIKNLKN